MPRKIIVYDVDNTLYDFIGSFAPAFRSMVHALSRSEGISEEIIVTSARDAYNSAKTVEQQFLIENMDIFQDLSEQERDRLIKLARVAFSRTRNKRLHLYDGVSQLLNDCYDQGFTNVCVTNAPYYHVERRLRRLRLMKFITGLVAWKGSPIETHISAYANRYKTVADRLRKELQFLDLLEYDELKPMGRSFFDIVERFGDRCEYYAIGDSITKDLVSAKAAGMTTIWARYGTVVDPVDLGTVLQVTPWTKSEIAPPEVDFAPDHVVDDIDKFRDVIGLETQGSLF